MATVKDIIKGSLRLIGAISNGENPSASELADGLTAFNEMLGSWSNENLLISSNTEEAFNLIANQQSYTMGTGGDFNTTWPIDIKSINYQDDAQSPKLELPLKVINLQEWTSLLLKESTSTIPRYVYIEETYPLKTIKLYPKPSVAKKLVIYSTKVIGNFSAATDTVDMRPGYLRAFKYNLALELAPEYGIDPSILVQSAAIDAKTAIKRQNIKPRYLKSDAPVSVKNKIYNILTGE